MIMGGNYRFGTLLQWSTYHAVEKIPFPMTTSVKITKVSYTLICKQCSLNQIAGSVFIKLLLIFEDKHVEAVTARE